MTDFSALVGTTFQSVYDDEPITVYGAYIHDGDLRLIVSKAGGSLFETEITGLKPIPSL